MAEWENGIISAFMLDPGEMADWVHLHLPRAGHLRGVRCYVGLQPVGQSDRQIRTCLGHSP